MRRLQELSASTPLSSQLSEGKERVVRVDLSSFDNSWYDPGRNAIVRSLWFFLGSPLVRTHLNPSSGLKAFVLRLFGARIGRNAVLHPGIRVKYPWRLSLGNHCWIGENVWLDNVGRITLSDHVCISQGAYLCTGNHDWSAPDFRLLVKEITLLEGSWVGAHSLIGPGVTLHDGAVASFGSVVVHDIPAFEIHSGNPASFVRHRRIKTVPIKP
jgi:putative colanic acid biosynthesis acetyltransferase WcaF